MEEEGGDVTVRSQFPFQPQAVDDYRMADKYQRVNDQRIKCKPVLLIMKILQQEAGDRHVHDDAKNKPRGY